MKKTKFSYMSFFAVFMLGILPPVFAQPSVSHAPVERAVFQAEQDHRLQAAVADLDFRWERSIYLSDMISRRRPGFKEVRLAVRQKQTHCRGVLAADRRRVLTVASCAKAPNGFSLKEVRISFSNGTSGTARADAVRVNDGLAEITAADSWAKGLKGAPVGTVPAGQTMAEAFGADISDRLLQFFIRRGVISARASRLTGVKNTLEVGEPFFYQGKMVALVSQVPGRLPVSRWGNVSEKHFLLLREHALNGLLANR